MEILGFIVFVGVLYLLATKTEKGRAFVAGIRNTLGW